MFNLTHQRIFSASGICLRIFSGSGIFSGRGTARAVPQFNCHRLIALGRPLRQAEAVPDSTPATVIRRFPYAHLSTLPSSTSASQKFRHKHLDGSHVIISTPYKHSISYINTMSIDAWADKARRSQYRQSTEPQRAITTLKTVFEGKETPMRAASTIASIYEPMLKRGFQLSPVNELWGMICEAATMLGGNREIDERLISLLHSISSLPDVLDESGDAVKAGPYGDYGVYWKDLPSLAIMFREYAIGMCTCTLLLFVHLAKQIIHAHQTLSPKRPKCRTKETGPTPKKQGF